MKLKNKHEDTMKVLQDRHQDELDSEAAKNLKNEETMAGLTNEIKNNRNELDKLKKAIKNMFG